LPTILKINVIYKYINAKIEIIRVTRRKKIHLFSFERKKDPLLSLFYDLLYKVNFISFTSNNPLARYNTTLQKKIVDVGRFSVYKILQKNLCPESH